MAYTMFGILELGKVGSQKSLPNATFRLHIASTISGADIFLGNFPRAVTLHNKTTVTVHLESYPSAGLIYERELYVSNERDRKGHKVLHLKEGGRFLEISAAADGTFVYMLADFLGQKIPELVELIS
ncbi:MAG: hypothetical protein HY507_01720 [Candidatus Zambryskibacteria bacterium]|nr:hypothetical protein [Candidatus Zambryskibacteria bacterium]